MIFKLNDHVDFELMLKIIIILFMVCGVIAAIFVIKAIVDDRRHPEEKRNEKSIKKYGQFGEDVVAFHLDELAKKIHGHLYNHFYCLDKEEKIIEIDHLLMTKAGLFVIETKNLKGKITGQFDDKLWIQVKEKETKSFTNPIHQNEMHIKRLKKLMNDNYPKMFNVIIFLQADIDEVKSNTIHSLESAINYIQKLNEEPFYSNQFVDGMDVKIANIIERYQIKEELTNE